MIKVLVIVCLLFVSTTLGWSSSSTEYACISPRVIDGDTIRCHIIRLGFGVALEDRNIRLDGVDTPEVLRPNCEAEKVKGLAAKASVAKLLKGCSDVWTTENGLDKYGRILGDIRCNGVSLSAYLMSQGLAKPYSGGKRSSWCE